MKFLTTDEHRQVVERLLSLICAHNGVKAHQAGIRYTSLLMCFLLHSKGAAESILTLYKQYGNEWFPATTGYLIVRSLFEVDVNSHYISRDPANRSQLYIDWELVVRKTTLDAVERHRVSPTASWREALQLMYNVDYAPRKATIEEDFERVKNRFEDSKGKLFKHWSGKSLYAMAKEVDHIEAYDIFYADLSSFTHVNVMLANKFLRNTPDGPTWTQKSREHDVANVFRYAAIFLSCFLEFFGTEFSLWESARVHACWDCPEAEGRQPKNLPATP